jgi:putative transposase
LSRSSYYYHPLGISEEELEIMKKIDQIYTDCPFYGVRKITAELKKPLIGIITNVSGG